MKPIIAQIIGPVVDVRFEGEALPAINTALTVKKHDGGYGTRFPIVSC